MRQTDCPPIVAATVPSGQGVEIWTGAQNWPPAPSAGAKPSGQTGAVMTGTGATGRAATRAGGGVEDPTTHLGGGCCSSATSDRTRAARSWVAVAAKALR
jgi:hypothetical protein